MGDNFIECLPAIRGIQAEREIFTFFVKFKSVSRLFDLGIDLPQELRAQRPLTKARITRIYHYLFNNFDSFVFPSVTACTGVFPIFEPIAGSCFIGTLKLSEKLSLHDGQHRIAGIMAFMGELFNLELHPRKNKHILEKLGFAPGLNCIPVTLFYDAGLKRSRQIFSDINRYSVKPKSSLIYEFDSRGSTF